MVLYVSIASITPVINGDYVSYESPLVILFQLTSDGEDWAQVQQVLKQLRGKTGSLQYNCENWEKRAIFAESKAASLKIEVAPFTTNYTCNCTATATVTSRHLFKLTLFSM